VAALPFTTRDLTLGHGRMLIARGGAEEAGGPRPIVLLHGLNSSHGCWIRVLPGLAATGRYVLAPDLPGFGGSDPVGEGYDVEAVADAVAAALDALDLPAVDLVGHSLGGLVATVLADRHPQRVARLVLVAGAGLEAHPITRPAPLAVLGEFSSRLVQLRRQYGSGLVRRPRARGLMFGTVVADTDALSPRDAQLLIDCSTGASRTAEALGAAMGADATSRLERLPAPVGAVWGDRDRLIAPAALAHLERVRPGSPVELVAGVGHVPMVEDPDGFVAGLGRVLAAMEPTRGGES
jgi:pimeloyl-ACP methyl ester carboxylesterase